MRGALGALAAFAVVISPWLAVADQDETISYQPDSQAEETLDDTEEAAQQAIQPVEDEVVVEDEAAAEASQDAADAEDDSSAQDTVEQGAEALDDSADAAAADVEDAAETLDQTNE